MAEPSVIPVVAVDPNAPYYEKHPAAVVRTRKPWARRPAGAPPPGVYMLPGTIDTKATGEAGRVIATLSVNQPLNYDYMFQIAWDQSDPIAVSMGAAPKEGEAVEGRAEVTPGSLVGAADIIATEATIAPPGSYKLVIEALVYDDPMRSYRQPIRVNLSP